jgi:hypothetical protein
MIRPRPVLVLALLTIGLLAVQVPGANRAGTGRPITSHQYIEDVKHLSAREMRGRGTGTPELDRAARYIATEFRKAGLRPLNGANYFQSFPVSVDSTLGPQNSFSYSIDGKTTQLQLSADFTPLGFSGTGAVTTGAVFAGYGITAREYGYDDYAGIDARGKIAIILAHEPQEYEGASPFEGRIYTEHSQLFSKALNARLHGAAGVVYVVDTANHSSAEKLDTFTSSVSPANPGLPFVQVRSGSVEAWFEAAGRDFKETQTAIDSDLKPRSFAFPETLSLSMQIDVSHRAREVHNVVGYVPGRTDEYIIVGAHYDHLGIGEQFSLAPEKIGTPHPGADDNASGTAGVMALARWFGAQPKAQRGVLFVAFAGEELGLLGSSYYVNNPALPLGKAILMINMDMIGRIREGKVLVSGASNGSPYRSRLQSLGQRHALTLDLDDSAVYGSSDHTSFKTKLIPILFFFSGLHGDYHRPTDTWDKIEAASAAKLLNLLTEFIFGLTSRSGEPHLANGTSHDSEPVVESAQ